MRSEAENVEVSHKVSYQKQGVALQLCKELNVDHVPPPDCQGLVCKPRRLALLLLDARPHAEAVVRLRRQEHGMAQ